MSSTQKKLPFNNTPANRPPQPVCKWSAHAPQSGLSPSPFPRHYHTLTATSTGDDNLLIFGGLVQGFASSDLYVFSTQDFSTTLLQTKGKVPSPRCTHRAALNGSTLLICGGETNTGDRDVLNDNSFYLLDLGTSDLLISSLTPADHSFTSQYRESGPALWSMALGLIIVKPIPQPWLVPSSSSLAVLIPARWFSMICGQSI